MTQRKSLFWLISALLASLLFVQTVGATDGRIVGGEEATPGEFPWMVSIQTTSGSHYCGGSLIASEWVLTASHCTEGSSPSQVTIVIGRHDLNSGDGQRINVEEIIMHEDYNRATLDYDVALLKLTESVEGVTPIGLVTSEMDVDDPDRATTISGWGALSFGGSSPSRLHKVTVPIVSNTTCNSSYGSITDRMICAGLAEGGKDSCQGDSGGPMMVRNSADDGWLQAGIVSWGQGCAWAGYYGVYARVSNLKSWIDDQIEQDSLPPVVVETIEGVVTAVSAESITIEDASIMRVLQTFAIDDETVLDGSPAIDDIVEIQYNVATNVAIKITVEDETTPPPAAIERVDGIVTAISAESITIDDGSERVNQTFAIDDDTHIYGTVDVGDAVRIRYNTSTDVAVRIRVTQDNDDDDDVSTSERIRGTVTEITAASITIETEADSRIATHTFTIDADTQIKGDPEVGDRVRIKYDSETLLASFIRKVGDNNGGWPGYDEYVEITGTLEAISDAVYTVDGVDYLINDDTYVEDSPVINDVVYIFALVDGDSYIALYIAPYENDLDGGDDYEFDWAGMVTAIGADSITVRNVWFGMSSEDTFIINDETMIDGSPVEGDFVEIHALYHADGTMTALYIEVIDDTQPTIERYEGIVTAIMSDSLTIDTEDETRAIVTFVVNSETHFSHTAQVGDYVRVKTERDAEGTLIALRVRVDRPEPVATTVRGVVTDITDVSITVDDGTLTTFAIDDGTMMRETPTVGDRVRVKGVEVDGVLTAVEIRVRQTQPEPIEYVEVIGTLEMSSTALYTVDGISYTIDADTVIEGTPAVNDTVYVFAQVIDEGSYLAIYIAKFDQPAERFELEGNVDAFDDSSITVDGQVISITEETKIRGTLTVDALVFVKGRVEGDVLVAKRVRVRSDEASERFVEALGQISAYSADSSITIDGKTFVIDADETEIEGTLELNRNAYAVGVSKDGVTTALFIQIVDEESTVGVIEDLSAAGLTINGQVIRINNRTRMSGNFTVGDTVYVGFESSTRASGQDALFVGSTTFVPTAVTLNSAPTVSGPIALSIVTTLFAALLTVTAWLSRANSARRD